MTTSNRPALGDLVCGQYYDRPFTGRIDQIGGSGVSIKFIEALDYRGDGSDMRDGCWLDARYGQTECLKVIERAENVSIEYDTYTGTAYAAK
jgi:hypothetical protein